MNTIENQQILPGMAPRVAASIIIFFGLLIFAITYVAFFATAYSLFQKISVIIVAMLAAIAVLGAMWASWAIKYSGECAEKECK